MKYNHKMKHLHIYVLYRCKIALIYTIILTFAVICASTACMLHIARESLVQYHAQPYPLETKPPYTVAIDAGHGHFDTGANGIIKEITLCETTCDKLYALLSADSSYKPILTRQKGENPKISKRASTAIAYKSSLLISIHGNCDHSSRSSHGFECYPTPPGRIYSAEAMRFAECIADGMGKAKHRLRGGGSGIRYAYYNGERKFMVDITDDKVRTQKSFGIVEKPLCPSVLVEQCFVTNSDDVYNWAGAKGCARAARIYYEAICTYFGTVPLQQ